MGTEPKRYVIEPDATVDNVDLDKEEVRLRDGIRLTEQRAAAEGKSLSALAREALDVG
jgi:hypothetical protein